jgi:conjugal transfer pilus assembly protein TraB
MSDPSQKALKKQKLNFILAATVAGVAVFGLGKYMFDNYQPPSYQLFEPKIDLPVDEFKDKEVWMDRLEAQINFLTQKQEYYEGTLLEYKEKERANEQEKAELKRYLTQLKRELADSTERLAQVENDKQSASQIAFLSPDESVVRSPFIDEEEGLDLPSFQRSQQPQPSSSDPFTSPPPRYASLHEELQEQPIETIPLRPPLCEYTMPQQEEKNELFSVEKKTPANVSVKAILISSVDAVCRLDAQSDPIPVKLRLLDDAHLPGGVTVKLKGCLLGASAYGDISSERVYMRLENLTKVNPNGQAIETEVTGYVSGEDGRFGMRGVVVDRSAKILKPALGSGILSGISQTLQSACTRPPKENINAYTIGSDFAQNTAAGTSDAFSMLASYYIRRAEQVQPVLQIDAGRIVDVTFTQGFSMGDIHAKANLKKVRERNRGRP